MLQTVNVDNVMRSMQCIIPCEITLCYKKSVTQSTLHQFSTNLKDWPAMQEGISKKTSVIIVATRKHQLCQKCPNLPSCTYIAEIYFPFAEITESGICIQIRETKLFAENADSVLSILTHFSDYINLLLLNNNLKTERILQDQQLSYLLKIFPEAVILLDKDKNITRYNKIAEEYKLTVDLSAKSDLSSFITNLGDANSANHLIQSSKGMLLEGKPFYANKKYIGGIIYTTQLYTPNKYITEKKDHPILSKIIGKHQSIQKIIAMIKQSAATDSTILLRGESGTGKELFAKAIHGFSPRATGPFVAINCSAIPEFLLESELFGYEEGSFTGAKKGGKIGKIEQANNGTLFLDEVGDMPLVLQAKLLRFIQDRRIDRIGGNRSIPVNVRIVAATHCNLEEMINEGTFRGDLFYRLSVIPAYIPPLRERPCDIELLVHYFLKKYCILLRKSMKIISYGALQKLLAYTWPGNVRELENMIEYLVNVHNQDVILPEQIPIKTGGLALTRNIGINSMAPMERPRPKSKAQNMKNNMIQILNTYGWGLDGKKTVAKELNISLATLYRRISKYKLKEE